MGESVLKDKSFVFAIRIVRLTQFLQSKKKEYLISGQILKSGTAIGALVREAEFGQSKADFIYKMSIALKEANETDYWISILFHTVYLQEKMHLSLASDCKEILAPLVSTVKTAKERNPIKSKPKLEKEGCGIKEYG
jgi:four helix bundle protein